MSPVSFAHFLIFTKIHDSNAGQNLCERFILSNSPYHTTKFSTVKTVGSFGWLAGSAKW